jgi:hypothetical protein
MSAVLTLTINAPASPFAAMGSEVAWIEHCLHIAAQEIRRDGGHTTSGTITGPSPAGPTASLGSWTYTASTVKP